MSVQSVVNDALAVVLQGEIDTIGSGRTDTGVHAEQQILHFDTPDILDEGICTHKLNCLLPTDIVVNTMRRVKADAHARYDAIERSYEYRIIQKKSPFLFNLSYYYTKPLDIVAMNEAAAFLLQIEDFESFSKVKTDVKTFICNIQKAEWLIQNDLLIFYVSADRFLRGMVRAMVGTMLEVGSGKTSLAEFKEIIASKDRRKAGISVPAGGLFLTGVTYPASLYHY